MPIGELDASGGNNRALRPDDSILAGRYRLLRLVSEGNLEKGVPSLWKVSDGASLSFAKVWRDDPAFPEVRAIWTHEVRSLLRLGGLPAADEVFVRLREIGDDPAGFVVVLDGEGREPLTSVLDVRARHPWLSNVRLGRVRRKLWQGLAKVARGLAMMHAEGTLHRALGPESVFTDLDGSCDFRMSGFEWSLRVSNSGGATDDLTTKPTIVAPELDLPASQYSVASDWFSFGLLCAQLIVGSGPKWDGEGHLDGLTKAISKAGLMPAERRLIVDLIDPDPERRMWQASDVAEAIEEISEALTGDPRDGDRPLYVGFDLGRDSKLTRSIFKLANGADVKTPEARLEFVKADLGVEPQVSARLRPFPHYVLHGACIDYLLTRWTSGSTGSWEAASCIRPDPHATMPPTRTYRFHRRRIEPRLAAWIASNNRSVRAYGEAWDEALPIAADDRSLSDEQARTIRFLHITNQIEALLTVVQIWPVTVEDAGQNGDHAFVDVTPTRDEDRDQLAALLGVPTPAEQMRRLFQTDDVVNNRSAEQLFVFGSEGRLLRRDQNLTNPWTFRSHSHHPAGPRYRFWQSEARQLPPRGAVFLRPRDLVGSNALLHRRRKAIDSFGAHRLMLDAIDDPASVSRTTTETPRESPAVLDLDPSKRAALAEAWRSQPIYVLQGPPGTGKTTLVATMTAEQVATSAATQVLITAQSHAVVDTVVDEVMEAFGSESGAFAIRLDADKEAVRRKDLGRRVVAAGLAAKLVESELARAAPARIRDRLATLCADTGQGGAAERGDFERLVENGASVTFGTSNSGDLARLLEAGRRYDWSIVEEAGRAHGFDLALPLQASHRALLIGDHQQLPPFDVEAMRKMLSAPDDLAKALALGSRFAPTLVERHTLGDLSDAERFAEDCSRWARSLILFQTLFEKCSKVDEADGGCIARRLTHQHRMHPDIRSIISECFYPDLVEAERAQKHFSEEPDPFERVDGGWLPSERIVFVDVPWIQRGQHARGEENRPPYTAPVEVDVVLKILGQFRRTKVRRRDGSDAPPPTIQVLSPYRAQVRSIRKAVRTLRAKGGLADLAEFRARGADDGELGATVDEFQGNQADVIVVSLVRNNHAKIGTGVGFLKDGTRWNVMLSRAKRKLIIVGSWDFLWSRFRHDVALPSDDPMADLAKVMCAIARAIEDGHGRARRITLQELPTELRAENVRGSRRSRRRRP